MTDEMLFRPPVLVGERVAWLGSGSGMPQSATVRWIGRIPEITHGWTVGIELDHPMPVGGIDGTWRKRQLFSCEPKRGLLVPVDKIMKESSLLNTRHSLSEAFYDVSTKKQSQRNQDLIRQLSLPQSSTCKEFLAKVLPQSDHQRQKKPICNPEVDLNNFKRTPPVSSPVAVKELTNDLNKTSSAANLNPIPLTIENVKAFDVEIRSRNEHRKKTIEELEKFKKHLDDLEQLKKSSHRLKKKRVGENPESLYSLARSASNAEPALFLRVVGEKTNNDVRKSSQGPVGEKVRDDLERYRSPKEKRKVDVKSVIIEEHEEIPIQSSGSAEKPSLNSRLQNLYHGTCSENQVLLNITALLTAKPPEHHIKPKPVKNELLVLSATETLLPVLDEISTDLTPDALIWDAVTERTEPENCSETVIYWENSGEFFEAASVIDETESVSGPTPTIRKKRQQQPVPAPRRRYSGSCDGARLCDAEPVDDTASVLYEPAFLTEYLQTQQTPAMTDVHGMFRRIEEDELEPTPATSHQPPRRLLTASVSVPVTPRKGLFSFFKWFKKDKPKNDLDLEDFEAPSLAGSPLFTRSRLANANSVDTLYSIATVSSFAFVSGAQYHNAFGSDKRKKRKAPPPPPQKRERSDSSLPNSLENRKKQQHRRSVSESYKDRRSGAFAHVNGKRKAPAPPAPQPQPTDRLYPSLSLVTDDSLTKKKRPAPLPPPELPSETSPVPAEEEIEVAVEIKPTSSSNVEETGVTEALTTAQNDVRNEIVANDDNVVCNDTLRLERGVLKPNKTTTTNNSPSAVPPKIAPASPVSPRPWYKRKSLEKRKERVSNDWMPEIGIPRPLASPEPNILKNLFSRSDEKKKEDKRKSGLSILANISELDREAAEICRKEQANQLKLLTDEDAKYYTDSPPAPEADVPKRGSTRELITLFNSIGSASNSRDKETKLPVAVCEKADIKTASVVDTKKCSDPSLSPILPQSQSRFDHRGQRQRSSSPISTITEISEPSSSAATLNLNAERIWTCTRCTLENLNWKNRCDACSACKPNFNARKMERRKSEMELDIDWEKELEKYFPSKYSSRNESDQIGRDGSAVKDDESEMKQEKDVKEKETTDPKEGDLDEIRKKRIAFFMKSLGANCSQEMSVRDAAAKKSLDENEKLKLKEMLKEMKNSLPKYEAAKNRGRAVSGAKPERLPDVTLNDTHNSSGLSSVAVDSNKSAKDAAKYGAIPKARKEDPKRAEALLVTTTTVLEDIIVKRKPQKNEPMLNVPVSHFSTDKSPDGSKADVRSGSGSYELMRVRDLANIIESKTSSAYPSHIYANYPRSKVSDDSTSESISESSGREVARLATQLTRASGLAEFRASLDEAGANTVAVNRLLRRLEAAIAAGRHDQAATLARELADLKVNCSVVRQKPSPSPTPAVITVEMYVEDKVSHQGPIPLRVQCSMTVSDLKMKVQTELHIPCHVQRWILGKQLANEDFRTLEELGVTMDNCPIFLYLVAPEPEPIVKVNAPSAPEEEQAGAAVANDEKKPLGKGWYFNYEEDRYSFCDSDSESNSPEREVKPSSKPKVQAKNLRKVHDANQDVELANKTALKITEPLSEKQENGLSGALLITEKSDRQFSKDTKNNETDYKKSSLISKSPKQKRRPLKPSMSLPEEAGSNLNGRAQDLPRISGSNSKNLSVSPEKKVEPARPRSRSIFDLIKPQANDTLKKDLKVISVNAVKETIEKLTRRPEAGWRCELCTLVNESARATCAACMAPRPPGFMPPVISPTEDELRRLRRNQAVDLPFLEPTPNDKGNAHYLELVGLDSAGYVKNQEEFDCPVCFTPQKEGEGAVLRECLHTFCRGCLALTIEHNEEAEVKCPYRDDNYSCESVLQEREIKALVPLAVFEQHLARGVAQAENRMGNAFHCKTPDCSGWCVLDDNVNQFSCPVCSHINCLTCSAIHEGIDCRTYQDRLKSSSDTNADAKRTRTMLEEMVQKGDAMACPTCQVVLMKKWGCDWLRCSMCKTEICWVTRGPRWGPAGKGDTSAGCQCGVNGVKCHPKCNYCH